MRETVLRNLIKRKELRDTQINTDPNSWWRLLIAIEIKLEGRTVGSGIIPHVHLHHTPARARRYEASTEAAQ
jgi:hypothetical protein